MKQKVAQRLQLRFVSFIKRSIRSGVFYCHTILTYSSILSIAHTGHCNRAYIFNRPNMHKIRHSLRIRKCLKELFKTKSRIMRKFAVFISEQQRQIPVVSLKVDQRNVLRYQNSCICIRQVLMYDTNRPEQPQKMGAGHFPPRTFAPCLKLHVRTFTP